MANKKEMKTCPWCGAHNSYGFVERDIGRGAGWLCAECNYFKEVKK
jgi:transposase-like protein